LLSLAQRAALKDQQKRGRVYLNGTHVSRVQGGADALRQQTDPLERWSSGVRDGTLPNAREND
jgi:hypothetical protein